ncbi:hypothetical protein QOT17_004334 [Balamuthia mandrillaris]
MSNTNQQQCPCPFCSLLPFELTSAILQWSAPSSPQALFGLASVSRCFRRALQHTDGLSINLGQVSCDQPERTERVCKALATTFPRLSLVSFTVAPHNINNYENTYAWYTAWTSPQLYGRLVMASLSGYWKDQGWGNRKGLLQFQCESTCTSGDKTDAAITSLRVAAAPGIAPHQGEHFETVVGRDGWPEGQLVGGGGEETGDGGFRLKLLYHVGGGGGHSLHVNDLSLTVSVSPHEWNIWKQEWIPIKLAHQKGWAWCMDGSHPSLLLKFSPNRIAEFLPVSNEEREPLRDYVTEQTRRLLGAQFRWRFYPLARLIVLLPISQEEEGEKKESGGPSHLLAFDKDYTEFYVYTADGGRGSRGFSLLHHPASPTIRSGFFHEDMHQAKLLFGSSNTTTSAANGELGKTMILNGIEVFNPFEDVRSYSSTWDARNSSPGRGHAQSMLDSPLAWCAGANQPGEWMEMPVAKQDEEREVLGVALQRREWGCSNQCVQKIQVEFKRADDGKKKEGEVEYAPTFRVGFGESCFSKPVQGRYFRILPTQWRGGHISMRAGLLVASDSSSSSSSSGHEDVILLNPPEDKRSYSSVWSNESPGVGHARSMINSPQAWSSGSVDEHQWMIIDAGSVISAVGLMVQVRNDYAQAVTGWRVETKDSLEEEQEWRLVDEGAEFFLDLSECKVFWLDRPVKANAVRIKALEWENHISMRCGVVLAPNN